LSAVVVDNLGTVELGKQILAGTHQKLLDQILPFALFVHDHQGRFRVVNDRVCQSVGYTRDELLNMSVTDLEQDFDLPAAQAEWGKLVPGEHAEAFGHLRRKDGSLFPVHVDITLLEADGERVYFGCSRDISKRRSAEEAVDRAAAQVRTMFEAMEEGLVLQVAGGKIVESNSAAARILGMTPDQLLGKSSLDPDWAAIRVDGSPFPGVEHPAMVSLGTGRSIRGTIMGVRNGRSETRWLSINVVPIFEGTSSEPSAVVTTFVDVTEQRNLAETLRIAQADLQAILDNVPARIAAWNADYSNRFINRKAEQDFGKPATAAAGKPVWEVIGADRFGRARPYIDAALAGSAQSHEQIDRQADGSPRYSQVSYIPKRRGETVVGLYTLAVDVTEVRSTFEKIRALAQRLEQVREQERRSISQVLHEGLAQDLFAMKLGIEHLQSHMVGRAGVTKAFEEISEAATKCIADSRQIANDLRPSALAHLRVSVAIEEHARYFGELSNLRIKVREWPSFPELGEAIRLLLFRAAQEALTNVARHAKASTVDVNLRADERHIVLEVTDDGVGIVSGEIEKPGSLGILGLRERVQAMGGGLSVSKLAGSGTIFSLQIPISSISNLS